MIILPHGGYALIPATLATMAWMTSLSLDGCDYARLTGPAVESLTNSNIYPYVEIGFRSYRIPSFYSDFESWKIRFSDPCIPYNIFDLSLPSQQEDLDEGKQQLEAPAVDPTSGFFWSIGSMSHKIGTIVGGAATMFLWVPCLCLSYTERTWRLGGLQLMLAAFFHLCSTVWFFNALCMGRGSSCHMFYGSYSTLITFVLYSTSCICIFLKYPQPIVVKLVRDRIKKEFQRYERSSGGGRPSLDRDASQVTELTSYDDESHAGGSSSVASSHLSEQFVNPVHSRSRHHRTGGSSFNEHQTI